MKTIFLYLIIPVFLISCQPEKKKDKTVTQSITVSHLEFDPGLVQIKSDYSFDETTARLNETLLQKGFKIIAVVPHSKAAKKAGIKLNPTTLFIFGNPKMGSPLMQCNPTVALDLPQRMLVWENDNNEVFITYNDPAYLQKRHELGDCGKKVIKKMTKGLASIARFAAKN